MMASSLLLYGRRVCIIIAVTILLFLPLTFSGNNNNALAQSYLFCDLFNYPATHDIDRCFYETRVESFYACLEGFGEYNERLVSWGLSPFDPSAWCQLPEPPEPRQPLNCNQLQTCPISDCDPTRANCPQQTQSLPFFPPPFSPEETCYQFGCIEAVPEGTPTPAEQREAARKFIEGLDNRRYNFWHGPAASGCESLRVENPEGCGGLTGPVWNIFKGAGKTIENGNKLNERLGSVPRQQPVPTGPPNP